MAACNAKRSISTVLRKNRGLWTVYITFEISAPGRSCFPWSVNFLGFILAAYGKVFRKASLSLMKEQVSWLSNMLPYFVPFWRNEWDSDLGLETERHRMTTSFDVGGDESLASKSSSLGVKSIRWEQNWSWFRRSASMCFFQNGSSTSGILNKSTASGKLACDDLMEKARVIELE